MNRFSSIPPKKNSFYKQFKLNGHHSVAGCQHSISISDGAVNKNNVVIIIIIFIGNNGFHC